MIFVYVIYGWKAVALWLIVW